MAPRDPEQTRARILEAAGRLFYRDGIRPVAMDAVAEMAGITKRTLYYHFDSKDDLVVAYLRHTGERLDASLARAMSRRGGSAMDRLLGLFEDLEARFAREEFRGCPFVNAAAELTASAPARAEAAIYKERMRAWFESGARELGAVRRPSGAVGAARDPARWRDRHLAGAARPACRGAGPRGRSRSPSVSHSHTDRDRNVRSRHV